MASSSSTGNLKRRRIDHNTVFANCFRCDEQYLEWTDLIIHLKTAHKLQDGNEFRCVKILTDNLECVTKLSSFRALKIHFNNDCCDLRSVPVSNPLIQNTPYTTTTTDVYPLIENAVQSYLDDIENLKLHYNVTNKIIKGFKEFISTTNELAAERINCSQIGSKCSDLIRNISSHMCSEIEKHETRYKREKVMIQSNNYNAPQTISLSNGQTFQFVSMLKTLELLFSDESFKKMYYRYNTQDHRCASNVYVDFCCSSNFKDIDLFNDGRAIQIKIFIDEFEACDALKSKSRKICGIYFSVSNISLKQRSKLKNMYLLALVEHDIIKTCGYNEILRPIIDELKELENKGVKIGDDETFKGTLVTVCFDNAGGNSLFGFIESFSGNYYCRICKATKAEIQTHFVEDKDLLRTQEEYEEILNNNTSTNSYGYKRATILNELKYFHILKCRSQDIMHDVLEGVVKVGLTELFTFLKSKTILSFDDICARINSYTYGKLEQRNKPSPITPQQLQKSHLHQSATQYRCLILNLSFILSDVLIPEIQNNNAVKVAWSCIEKLLRIMQIIWSPSIEEKYLLELEKLVELFLTDFVLIFRRGITPKMHFMVHYPNTIRASGPLIHMAMLRAESKHKEFKDFAKSSNNYINVTKSMASKHQAGIFNDLKWENSYEDNISHGKMVELSKKITENEDSHKYLECLTKSFESVDDIKIVKFVIINRCRYQKGLFVVHSESVANIIEIIFEPKMKEYYLLCDKYCISGFNSYSNSIEIRDLSQIPVIIPIKSLNNETSYDAKLLQGRLYIVATTLELPFQHL